MIDNAIAATWRKERSERHGPRVTITLEEGETVEDATLIIEDNGGCAGHAGSHVG